MADINIKEISDLKKKIYVLDKVTLVLWVALVLLIYFNQNEIFLLLLFIQIALYIVRRRCKKRLKEKEYLAKMVEERTIELRIQRDKSLKESKELSDALEALAKAQDELVRKERLATVGSLTKGLVDRILNPVNYINNFAGLSASLTRELEEEIASSRECLGQEKFDDINEMLAIIKQNLDKIDGHGRSMVKLIKDMEELLRDREGKMAEADLCALCRVGTEVFARTHREEMEAGGIALNLICPDAPVTAEINVEQFGKLLDNLLRNSLYALKKKQSRVDFSPSVTVKVEQLPHDAARLSVRDNGIGIEENIRSRIFEPFFTTKPTAEASGVGLFYCRETVLRHKGSIEVLSEKDRYTEIIVTIPNTQKHQGDE